MIRVSLREIVQSAARTSSGRTPLMAFESLSLESAQKSWERMLKVEKVEEHLTRFSKARTGVFTKYSAKDSDGRELPIDVSHPNFTGIDRAIGELLDVIVELDFDTISVSELGDGRISPEEIKGIKFLISKS